MGKLRVTKDRFAADKRLPESLVACLEMTLLVGIVGIFIMLFPSRRS